MKKQEEIDLYANFVMGLPRGSYLHDILTGSEVEIERQIRSDFALSGTILGIINERRRVEQQLLESQKQLREVRAEVTQLEGSVSQHRQALRSIANTAELVAEKARQLAV